MVSVAGMLGSWRERVGNVWEWEERGRRYGGALGFAESGVS